MEHFARVAWQPSKFSRIEKDDPAIQTVVGGMSGYFQKELAARNPDEGDRTWAYVAYDQLNDQIGGLKEEAPENLGIVLVESSWKAGLRPYHKQKLGLLLANQRAFALEQADRGVCVRYRTVDTPYAVALAKELRELPTLYAMEPAERELRRDLDALSDAEGWKVAPHDGWLTTRAQFHQSQSKNPPWRMDRFYRAVRKATGFLMEEGNPVGGKWSFDAENRKPWRGSPPAPEGLSFPRDPLREEVESLIERKYFRHPGVCDLTKIPVTRKEALQLWDWAKKHCLPCFGPYEDAMSVQSRHLFHTRISSLLNLCRLLPEEVVRDALALDIPLASQEGFVRQILGWREFVRHVHQETDGFRESSGGITAKPADAPGDGGWGHWKKEAWGISKGSLESYGGARPSYLDAPVSLPSAFWGEPSGMKCLDLSVEQVWEEGYSHHIQRLMILSNFATLLGVSPRELSDWFWVAYTDAYDWVVEPNVLGMGTFAAGDMMTTKPYVSGANYINKMSDYCGECSFDPKKNCPWTPMYWAFYERHREKLEKLPRIGMAYRMLAKRTEEQKKQDQRIYAWVRETLEKGRSLLPDDLPQGHAGEKL